MDGMGAGYAGILDTGIRAAGTGYEEWRCLRKEYELFPRLNTINPYDWSYDPPVEAYQHPNYRNQGKQWKN